jgi:hypothetical protein
MIIWDDNFLTELDENRILAITGRLSSGKTLLAVELAQRYLKQGYRLASQIACVWNDPLESIIPDPVTGKLKVVCIIDEGGIYFKQATTADSISTFAAKLDTYIIFAGRKLPHRSLCSLTCQVWFNFYKYFGLPFKVWRYDVHNGHKSYAGYFVETGWQEYYGIYDTLDPGDNPARITRKFDEWTKYFFSKYNRTYDIRDVGTARREDEVEIFNSFSDSAAELSDAIQAIPKLKKR